jgi:hypothetical protein
MYPYNTILLELQIQAANSVKEKMLNFVFKICRFKNKIVLNKISRIGKDI